MPKGIAPAVPEWHRASHAAGIALHAEGHCASSAPGHWMTRRREVLGVLLLAAAVMAGLAARPLPAPSAGVALPPAPGVPGNPANDAPICHAAPTRPSAPSGELLLPSPSTPSRPVHGQGSWRASTVTNAQFPPPVTARLGDYVRAPPSAPIATADKYEAWNQEAAVCTDCHGAHDVRAIDEAQRASIPHTCERCHSAIYGAYRESVHGAALIDEGNPDVPTCIDCHESTTSRARRPVRSTLFADDLRPPPCRSGADDPLWIEHRDPRHSVPLPRDDSAALREARPGPGNEQTGLHRRHGSTTSNGWTTRTAPSSRRTRWSLPSLPSGRHGQFRRLAAITRRIRSTLHWSTM
jgi:hypothetical protein